MSELRAMLLGHLDQLSATDSSVQIEYFLDHFSALHCLQNSMVRDALDDLRRFGLVQTTPEAVALTSLAKRLLR
jgi:hypothetical protein